MNLNPHLEFGPAVHMALVEKKPIVALETSIISQGMPYPHNHETALLLEETIRQQDCTPATIGIVEGKIKVGLTPDELKFFSTDRDVKKINNRDIPVALERGWNGATTVSGTLACARLASIEILATGGIGGIHREFSETHDMSADLHQIANTTAITVCSGAKAILDIPKTLEMLETLGVIVGTYQNEEFPAFWSRNSGYQSPLRLNTVEEISAIFKTSRQLFNEQGFLVANPIPVEFEIPRNIIEPFIKASLAKARAQNIKGKELTPYLLNSLNELSLGQCLKSNIELIKNNANLAAQIAKKLSSI
ncbi:MAG: pseudouridine-5'-phosphate glycosidase [Paracoccaceae bacterium]|nr:pseudouridine-5'-phosphate glycosidase [Paracoccaceae bacterium]MDE2675222.1 pseudouridine-5'-phosphate glycosidase [Paracoccaceae bacterium]MDE2738962.1 pseudouridine-5'-phosphate glycosidase [Paracoccaceae bacterium]